MYLLPKISSLVNIIWIPTLLIMKIAAARALASFVKNPNCEYIIPSAFDEWVANKVAEAVKNI